MTDAAFPDAQPVAVLELEGDRWRDVSRRCALYYDEAIAEWRQRLTQHSAEGDSENLVLRITLAYLYSGRAVLAWKTLAALEPPGTLEAQRMEILQRWSRGVLAQAGILH